MWQEEIQIEIEDMIGNAFINSLVHKGQRILEISKIDQYASKVLEYLNVNGKKAHFNVSREKEEDFFYRYSHWFTRVKTKDKTVVVLKGDVTSIQLYKEFAASLSSNVLSIYEDWNNVVVLF